MISRFMGECMTMQKTWGRHFAGDIFKRICVNKNDGISIKISLKFVTKCLFNNIPASVQIMDWRRPGDNSLFKPMMAS